MFNDQSVGLRQNIKNNQLKLYRIQVIHQIVFIHNV